jgi:hypothetical protein
MIKDNKRAEVLARPSSDFVWPEGGCRFGDEVVDEVVKQCRIKARIIRLLAARGARRLVDEVGRGIGE